MKKYTLLLIVPLLFFVTGCDKDTYGCTDPDSTNYNAYANVNDNSCIYEGEVLVWWDEDFSTEAQWLWGPISINTYIDGEFSGAVTTTTYWTGIPSCEDATVKEVVDLGYLKQKDIVIEYYIGSSIGTQSTTVFANTCNTVKLWID